MRYCKHCHIHYDTPLEHCLLCNQLLEKTEKTPVYKYASYTKKSKTASFFAKIWFYLNIITISTSIFIDYQVNHHLYWSLVVTASCVYSVLLMFVFYKRQTWQSYITWFILLTILLVNMVGLIIRDYHWALDYVLPFSLMLNMLTFASSLLFTKKRFFDDVMYLFIVSFLGIIPLILVFTRTVNILWPSIASFGLAIAALLGLFIFSFSKMKEELKRRFHV